MAELAAGQESVRQPDASSTTSAHHTTSALAPFLVGAAAAFGAHETGHLLFDSVFHAHPVVKKVSFHGVPFFAITHDAGLSARREFVIDCDRIVAENLPMLTRVVVAIDPAVTSGEDADETGIVVAGIDQAGHVYILEDLTCRVSPQEWVRIAQQAYTEYGADRIVADGVAGRVK